VQLDARTVTSLSSDGLTVEAAKEEYLYMESDDNRNQHCLESKKYIIHCSTPSKAWVHCFVHSFAIEGVVGTFILHVIGVIEAVLVAMLLSIA
jgi:hypothetical protein